MNEPDILEELLRDTRTIAVVGLSANPERPSHGVASYLREQGYSLLPVNPTLTEWEGLPAYPSLGAIPYDQPVDLVQVFRRPEQVPRLVEEVLLYKQEKHIRGLWLQEGVIHQEAALTAELAGLKVVMDRCMLKEHQRLLGGKAPSPSNG